MLDSLESDFRVVHSTSTVDQQLNELVAAFDAERSRLANHPVFQAVRDLGDLRTFMEWHVFAVWDFMSLVKRLQRDFTCIVVPWSPPISRAAARFINEIVMGEESDQTPDGSYGSHYELYLSAMREVGASTERIEELVQRVRRGSPVEEALLHAQAPAPVGRFVKGTLSTCLSGTTVEVLGSFFYGRENAIPQMFEALLARWGVDPRDVPTFTYYLRRHIELDGDSHGPAAKDIIDRFVDSNGQGRVELLTSAVKALRERVLLWDALHREISSNDDARTVSLPARIRLETLRPVRLDNVTEPSGLQEQKQEAP